MRDMSDDQAKLTEALLSCAKGERQALRAIFDSEAPRLLAMARRILRRRDLAEEAVQETFVRIWTKAESFAPERGSARGWIYAIARNQALNMLRDAGREIPEGEIEAIDEAALASTPEALGERSRLRECLEALDAPKRRSVLLAHLYGFTHGEIAGRLGVPLGTAKSWVRRGLAALRECLS